MSKNELVNSLINADNMDTLIVGCNDGTFAITCKEDIIIGDNNMGMIMCDNSIEYLDYSSILQIINIDKE